MWLFLPYVGSPLFQLLLVFFTTHFKETSSNYFTILKFMICFLSQPVVICTALDSDYSFILSHGAYMNIKSYFLFNYLKLMVPLTFTWSPKI